MLPKQKVLAALIGAGVGGLGGAGIGKSMDLATEAAYDAASLPTKLAIEWEKLKGNI